MSHSILAVITPMLAAVTAGAVSEFWVIGPVMVFAFAGPMLLFSGRRKGLRQLEKAIRRLTEGDYETAIDPPGGILAPLAEEIAHLRESLRESTGRVNNAATDHADKLGATMKDVDKLSRFIADQIGGIDRVTTNLETINSSLRGISDSVEVLQGAAEESSASILEMAAANNEIAENMAALGGSVSESASSIEEMTYSTKEVANNVLELSSTTEETSSSMNEMDMSIHQVQNSADQTAKLSEEVARAAGAGVEALRQTTEAIHRIKDSSSEATTVIGTLGAKIGEIDKILQVIDDVAEQTNLLALNAAIIAAQAGEHGKGFAVVADEIKDLAERAGVSTKEIADLIKTVQNESANAIKVIEVSSRSVDEGVKVSHDAEAALRRILDSAEKTRLMMRDIARATEEQARGSKQVTDAINRIAETVQSIATATTQQSKGSESIMRTAEKIRVVTKQVERSSQEQNRGSQQITRSVESIADLVNNLSSSHRETSAAAEQLLEAMVEVRRSLRDKTTDVDTLRAQLSSLEIAASKLRTAARVQAQN